MKFNLKNLLGQFGSIDLLNKNFKDIEDEFQNKVLYRDNPANEPNSMQNDLDMNSFDLLNVGNIDSDGNLVNTPNFGIENNQNLITEDAKGINFSNNLNVTDDGDGTVTVTGSGSGTGNTEIFVANTISELKATQASAGKIINLNNDKLSGIFDILSGNFNNEIQSDVQNGIYIPLDDDPDAFNKVAKRRVLEGINPFWFGAFGDDVNDDSFAIQAAINQANNGDEIYFPSPEVSYKIQNSILVNKTVNIVGNQSKITSNSAIILFDILSDDASLEGFVIEGDRTSGQIAFGVKANNVKIQNCNIELTDKGIEVASGVVQRIQHIRSRNIANIVIEIGNTIGTVAEDVRYDTDIETYSQPNKGLALWSRGCNFSDFDLIHAGTACSIFTNNAETNWNFFNSCSFDSSTYGVRVENTNSAQITKGVMFDHCWFASHSENGALIDGNFSTDGISFKGCYFVNNGKEGISIENAGDNVEIISCTLADNSTSSFGSFSDIKHASLGNVGISGCNFNEWGSHNNSTAKAAVERTNSGSFILIDGCLADSNSVNNGFIDNNTSVTKQIGINFGLLPSQNTGGNGNFIPNDTSLSSGDINITSSASTGTIRSESDNSRAFEGTSNDSAQPTALFSNTAGGAGLRVNQGDTQLAGNAQVDVNLAVAGTSTLGGSVGGTGFNNSVDSRITFDALNSNNDVGTGSTQVAQGNHSHSSADIVDLQKSLMFSQQVTTDSNGLATISHNLGIAPPIALAGTFGGANTLIQTSAVSSTSVTVEARDLGSGSLKTNSTHQVYLVLAENP